MAYIEQRCKTDCGVACLAMLCDVTYEEALKAIPWRKRGMLEGCSTRMIREGAEALGFGVRGTKTDRLKTVREPKAWRGLPNPITEDFWRMIPDNSLVKIKHDHGYTQNGWHWVSWRKQKVYDPGRGVFHPGKFGHKPRAYLEILK